MNGRARLAVILWLAFTLSAAIYLGMRLYSGDKTVFLPGPTSHGHHQIEMACEACHAKSFADREGLQEACLNCHEDELARSRDSHPKSKFTNPRNAARTALLDARYCVTCHVEHRPEITQAMGVTLPPDVCFQCHQEVAKEVPSRAKLSDFTSCASAGCHNFHDNRALYEDFLIKHGHDPDMTPEPYLALREMSRRIAQESGYPAMDFPDKPLTAGDADSPSGHINPDVIAHWLGGGHAKRGVNCTACHDDAGEWLEQPTHEVCASCHQGEQAGFLDGKHGMRLKQGLSPMTPAMARIPMHADAKGPLGCTSCHAAHTDDTRNAAVDACLICHADEHSRAYRGSPHEALWNNELSGEAPPGSGVSCASCHLPRIEGQDGHIGVQHNQNDSLRPNEKMIRPVCQQCHGLKFSIDALADEALIDSNFKGMPTGHIDSIDMALKKDREHQGEHKAEGEE